jgi:hypothetical protein
MPILTTLGAACAKAWGFTSGLVKDQYFNLVSLLLPGNNTDGKQNNTFLDTGNPAEFTASIVGTTMTVTAVASGTIKVGIRILGTGVTANTTITALGTGTGGVGTYTVSASQAVASTTITSDGFPITRNGNTTQGTFSPFSQTGWGNYFNGSSAITMPSNSAFKPGSSDFTIECWYFGAAISGVNQYLWGDGDSSTNNGIIAVRITPTGNFAADYFTGPTTAINRVTTGTINANAWNHICVSKTGTTLYIGINGVLETFVGPSSMQSPATVNPAIGRLGAYTAGGYLTGYISNFRYVVGSALYTTNPYTVPKNNLTAISGTSLLTCQSNRFLDNSANNFTITAAGSPSVVAFSPFAPTAAYTTAAVGGSGYFDGTGDYLSVANTGLFGSGDWTVEMWINAPVGQTDKPILECRNPATGAGSTTGFTLTLITSTEIRLFSGSELLRGTVNYINTWAHVAVSKKSGTTRLYLNGTSVASTASLGTMSDTTFLVAAGYYGSTSVNTYGQFYMSGLRVLTGTGYDTSTITIPTAPPTAITNTSLLLNYTNAGITDATAKNDLETVGNAQISTSVSKFGGGSIAFDGTGDYLTRPYSDLLNINSGDFTIEAWVYPTANKTFNTIASMWGTAQQSWIFDINNGVAGFAWQANSVSVNLLESGSVSLNAWSHLAVTRAGNTFKLFVNGTQTASATSSNNSLTSIFMVGAYDSGASGNFAGYIDDLRITKGYARYTASFTAPTAPFPVQ